MAAILKQGGLFNPATDNQRTLSRIVKKYPGTVLVAEQNKKVIGTISVQLGRVPMLFRLATLKENRQQGVGSLLLKEAEKRIKKAGYKESYLLAENRNSRLQGFYSKVGYLSGGVYRWRYKKL